MTAGVAVIARIATLAAMSISLGVGCGPGLDTHYTDDGHRYTLWVAKRNGAAIEALILDPKERRLENRREFSDAAMTGTLGALAVERSGNGLIVVDETVPSVFFWRIEGAGESLSQASSHGIAGTVKQAIFSGGEADRVNLLIDNGSSTFIRSLITGWNGGAPSDYSGTVGTPGAIQMAAAPGDSALVVTRTTGYPMRFFMNGSQLDYGSDLSVLPTNLGAVGIGRYGKLYVGANGGSQLYQADVDGSGAVSGVVSGPNAQSAVLQIAPDPEQRFLAVTGNEGAAGSVRLYALNETGEIGSQLDSRVIGANARQLSIDPAGRMLAISDCTNNRVHVFLINRASIITLRAMVGSPYAVASCPDGIGWSRIPTR